MKIYDVKLTVILLGVATISILALAGFPNLRPSGFSLSRNDDPVQVWCERGTGAKVFANQKPSEGEFSPCAELSVSETCGSSGNRFFVRETRANAPLSRCSP